MDAVVAVVRGVSRVAVVPHTSISAWMALGGCGSCKPVVRVFTGNTTHYVLKHRALGARVGTWTSGRLFQEGVPILCDGTRSRSAYQGRAETHWPGADDTRPALATERGSSIAMTESTLTILLSLRPGPHRSRRPGSEAMPAIMRIGSRRRGARCLS
jgi:hypothetical protein